MITTASEIKQNFWKYCKNIFESKETINPTFDETTCFKYFKGIFDEKNPTRSFKFPSWVSPFAVPQKSFNQENPTYGEIRKIIFKMKSSGSPCPLDHISTIMLKKCPIRMTQAWRICVYCWEHKYFPASFPVLPISLQTSVLSR